MQVHVQRTAEQVLAVNPSEGKVYIFVEPTPEMLAVLTSGKPDEHQGVHCVSFLLDNEQATTQAIAFTQVIMEAEADG